MSLRSKPLSLWLWTLLHIHSFKCDFIPWREHRNPELFSIPIFYFLLCISIKIVLSILFWDSSLTFPWVCQGKTKHKITHKSFKVKGLCPVVELAANTVFTSSIWERSPGLISSSVELLNCFLWHKLLCPIWRDRHENGFISHKS